MSSLTTHPLSRYTGSCGGKATYSSKKEAAKAASRLKKRIVRSTGLSEPVEAYHCQDDCHAWHVGHPRGWRRNMGVARPVIKTTL